jgi:hypothetical protein
MKLYIKASTGFQKADAYWIDLTGKVLPVKGIHIEEVIDTPEAYGFTLEQIQEVYDKYSETLKWEGKAREEIIEQMLKRGWIRIRHYGRNDIWSIQCFNFGSRQKDYLFRWAKDITENEHRKYADVRLDTGNEVHMTSVKDLMSSDILCSTNKKDRAEITYITASWEFLEVPYRA